MQRIALSASSRTSRAVTEVLSEDGVVPLDSGRRTCVALGHRAVDHIEATLPLIQPQLVVGLLGGVVEIDGAPFDVEDSIGWTPGH